MSVHELPVKATKKTLSVDTTGGGGDDGSMEARVAKLEALIPTLATKEDLLRLEVKLHQELHGLTWKMMGSQAALVAAVYFIAKYVS